MNNMALDLVRHVMGWDEGKATQEYTWLRLMSDVKYDGYADYLAGVRFTENLAIWLKQFKESDRPVAYNFIKNRLVYVSPAEMNRLIEAFIPEIVTPEIRNRVSKEIGVQPYEIWRDKQGNDLFAKMLKKTLFIGMSDGSRIDIFRRSNSKISTEQVVGALSFDDNKWLSLGKKLSKNLGCGIEAAKFDHVYLIDDFTASGTTFIRYKDHKWEGKLEKFNASVKEAKQNINGSFPLAENYTLHIHHYLSSYQARQALIERVNQAINKWQDKTFGTAHVTEGLLLPEDLKMEGDRDKKMLKICDEYYDDFLYQRLKDHCDQAGQSHMRRGYADCALPVVLEHNTPNNSISLLWAQTAGKDDNTHSMQPLFFRRDRHG